MDVGDRIDDVSAVLRSRVLFAIDPDDTLWFVGDADGERVWMKLNAEFPDTSLYSVWLGDGHWRHLDDLPASWTMPDAPYVWPDTARPAPVSDGWD